VITRLRGAGAVVLGKTNMDEFAMGSSTEFSAFGPTRNPAHPGHVPGGSSGGSAAAVASGICRVALGSDTAGSVRQPAAFCGVVGVKPTYGRVSRFGLVALASSLDQIGVFGTTVGDAARALEAIAGYDPRDSTSADLPVPDCSDADVPPLSGTVVGIPREYFPEDLHPDVAARCRRVIDMIRRAGASIREVSLPHSELAVPVYHVIGSAEAASNLSRFDGVRFGARGPGSPVADVYERARAGFGTEVVRRVLLGTHFLASAGQPLFRKALQIRALIAGDFAHAFAGGIDVLFTPTTPTPAFPRGGKTSAYSMYESDAFTVAANLAGVPALSLPIGLSGPLPVGGQIMAPHFAEQRMFAVAYAIERELLAEQLQ
jgi:aspartyl-tRNA(Asn)/glutamyl-tRNA(Gln) amidotransferase subunit A